jgi:hypothetical protein
MLLQTNSYIVPKDKRTQHARLVQRFRQTLTRLGCDHFEAYEQVGANWSPADTTGRFVQLMRFRDRKHQLAVQGAERNDATAQALIKEFCELINFPYQQQQGLFAVGFYHSLLPTLTPRAGAGGDAASEPVPQASAAPVPQGEHEPKEREPDPEPPLSESQSPALASVIAEDQTVERMADDARDDLGLSLVNEESAEKPAEARNVDPDADALLEEMESGDEAVDFDMSDLDITQEPNAPK